MSSRRKPVTRQIRAMRRREAEARQAEYDKLTVQQKLDRLPPAPAAAKQRAKLEAILSRPKSNFDARKFSDLGRASGDNLSIVAAESDVVEPKKLKAKERRAQEKK